MKIVFGAWHNFKLAGLLGWAAKVRAVNDHCLLTCYPSAHFAKLQQKCGLFGKYIGNRSLYFVMILIICLCMVFLYCVLVCQQM